MAFTIFTVVALLGILALAVREVVMFSRQRESYRLRRLTLRLCTSGMLIFLIGSIYAGIRWFRLENPGGTPRHWLLFWGCIALLTCAILCMVVADMRMVASETRQDIDQLWHDVAEMIAKRELEKKDR